MNLPAFRAPLPGLLVATLFSLSALGQDLIPPPPMAVLEPVVLQSGLHTNPTSAPATVFSQLVLFPGASSLRLLFSSLDLGPSDSLRVSSPLTGEVHLLDASERAKWQDTSGFFNGDRLQVELILGPGSTGSFTMTEALVGRDPFGQETICGADDRVNSTDFKSMRFSTLAAGVAASAGCTIWLASTNDCALSAGHCFSGGTLLVAETMCPPSTTGGAVQHPPIRYQFTVDTTTIAFTDGGIGNDWGVCRLNLNNLGESPAALFGNFIVMPTLPTAGNPIRITGYGTDSGVANQTLQTHVGPAVAPTGTQLRYATDTTGGNSGSPVIDATTGFAVGIHTHGGCTTTGGSNSGTSASHAAFQTAFTALNCPSGPLPDPEYQVNQADSTLLVDGVVGFPAFAAKTQRCVNQLASLSGEGNAANLGQAYEVGISFLPLVPRSAGGLPAAGTQVINLNVASLIFLSTLGPVPALPAWTGPFALPLPSGSPGTISFQMFNTSPSHPDGYALSQGCEFEILAGSGVWPAGPTANDTSLVVPLGGTTCIASIPFFGVARTSLSVLPNGRIMFGGTDSDFTPTVNESLTDNPAVGFWTDLNPATGGTITIASLAQDEVTISWNAVPYAGLTTTVSFSVTFNAQSGVITIDGLTGIPSNPGTATSDNQWLGISRGNSGATNLGATTFTAGGSGVAGDANRAWYDFYLGSSATGRLASLLPGTLNSIVFTPLPNSNYAWQGF